MSFIGVAAIAGVAGIGGALIESNATQSAADTQAAAAANASQLQYNMYEQQFGAQAPWRAAGEQALTQMQDPYFQQKFGMAQFQEDPAYQFDLQQGQQAIQRSAAAMGGLQSGGTMKALSNYAQGQASNEYQNAYARYTNDQTNAFNRLASLAQLGQTSNGQMAQVGMNTANQVGNDITGAGNASAAASIAQGNIFGNTLSGLGSSIGNNLAQYQSQQNMNNMFSSLYAGGAGASMLPGQPGYQSPLNNFTMPTMGAQFNPSGPVGYSGTGYSLF